MSRTIGIAHDVARRVELGIECAECAEPFVRSHGHPVLCEYCARQYARERVMPPHPVATHPEATATHFRNEAKRRKTNQENTQ